MGNDERDFNDIWCFSAFFSLRLCVKHLYN